MQNSHGANDLASLTRENLRLRKAVEELSILNEIATAINSTGSLDKIVSLIVQKCVKFLKVEQAAVMLLDEQEQDKGFHTMVRKADTSASFLPFRLDTHLTGWMLKYQKPLLVTNLCEDDRFTGLIEKDCPIKSLLSVPLIFKGNMIGLLTAFNQKSPEGFTAESQRLLSIIATQSSQVIQNARLLEKEKELVRVREEMRMAYEIQVNLLPKSAPEIPGYDIAGKSIPAKFVGGDYFDFIPIGDNQLAFCLGDVTGKGMPAALLMSHIQATIHSQVISAPQPRECMRNTNTIIYQNTGMGKFITMYYGILDFTNHRIVYCNAGHDFPFFFENPNENPNSISRLEKGGLVLGFVPEFQYAQEEISVAPGSLLVLYSDGIPEAKNQQDEEFGEERLEAVLRESLDLPSQKLVDTIIEAVEQHAGDTPQSDDITLVVIRRLKN